MPGAGGRGAWGRGSFQLDEAWSRSDLGAGSQVKGVCDGRGYLTICLSQILLLSLGPRRVTPEADAGLCLCHLAFLCQGEGVLSPISGLQASVLWPLGPWEGRQRAAFGPCWVCSAGRPALDLLKAELQETNPTPRGRLWLVSSCCGS